MELTYRLADVNLKKRVEADVCIKKNRIQKADKPYKAQIGSKPIESPVGLIFFAPFSNLFVKKVVQDLTSGGEDCFPKYTKQFLKHYYDTNEIFQRRESDEEKR